MSTTTYEINIETLGFHSYDYNLKEIIDKVNYTHDNTDYVSSRVTRFINKKKKAQNLFKILATASTYDLCEINVRVQLLKIKEQYIMKIYVKRVKNTKGEFKESLWIDFYDNDGKRQRKSLKLENTKANMKLAKNKIIPALLHKLENNKFIEKQVPTLDEYMVISFKMNEGTRTKSTQYGYQVAYDKRISPVLGHRKIDTIKPADVKLLQSGLVNVVSPRRIKNIRAVLNGILSDALDNDLIIKNPVSSTKTIPLDDSEIHPFSMDEISLILENSEGQYKNFFALGFMSGMRSGEMIALRWSDIDFFANSNIKCNFLKVS